MMCCCQSQIAIDYMKSCINPLWLVYVLAPLLPPPLRQSPPLLSHTLRLSLPVSILTRGTQGCPKTISLDKIFGIHLFENLPKPPFFCRSTPVHFCNTFCQKCSPFFHCPSTREFFLFFRSLQLFSPLPNECQLFVPKDFWDLPV